LKYEGVIHECINTNDEEKAKKDNQINFVSKHIRLEKRCLEAEIETDLRVIRLENRRNYNPPASTLDKIIVN
jgi:hypothetical protein